MITFDCQKSLQSSQGALRLDVQFELAAGACAALFGVSGAGKTTLLRMLAGLTAPDSGCITVDGQCWYDSARGINLPPQQRALGLVFQDYALFPNLNVAQQVAYALPAGQEQVCQRLLELSGLAALRERLPAQLSGGQKQRVALARALGRVIGSQARVLLLDEALTALDSAMRAQLQDELIQLQREFGLTTLFVSHDVGEVFKLAQQVFLLENGTVARSGSPSEMFLQQRMQGQLLLQAQVLAVRREEVVFILSLLVGADIVEIIAAADEVQNLQVGERIAISAKAFSPLIVRNKPAVAIS
ncbi:MULTISPECIES: ABC transporter ATP-binding protein [unclassified Undibacterium]|uniref:ABC transporter ATP-binding protein n=1 Tax=unclassified Undibacterium TaxID=2630295 RepID=UPI002AC8FBFB|nr:MULTISPECIES: ABC transporter ATP-binding protein [unclassified Undibacterium]MEB0137747.1 ABC transporter ATP-binding protein [Undibacterium sp. CCC2.1]MEB0172811.1 ABC transporter ATP-binding protein [Undibacterium sp. CCC1.1]MEB0176715.1 ABC transporter ATP-binding protein [Undibacterium sp. CCC3.4]MEB0215959.1 ABC transporter ATP-binding protein [Undibacterium sp. 5I2]WPX42322.1 ABC transporter ATP-binding protein [Undibacterium sp. CCC3.4]